MKDKYLAERNRKRRMFNEAMQVARTVAADTGIGQFVWSEGGFDKHTYEVKLGETLAIKANTWGSTIRYVPSPTEGAPTPEEVYNLYTRIFDHHDKMLSSGVKFDYDEYRKAEKEFENEILKMTTRARHFNGDGVLAVGRQYTAPVADGYARYLVYEVRKTNVRVLHLALGDAWQDRSVSPSGLLPMRLAKCITQGDGGYYDQFGDLVLESEEE